MKSWAKIMMVVMMMGFATFGGVGGVGGFFSACSGPMRGRTLNPTKAEREAQEEACEKDKACREEKEAIRRDCILWKGEGGRC